VILPNRIPRLADGTSSGYPTDIPPGRPRKSFLARRGKTRGRGTGSGAVAYIPGGGTANNYLIRIDDQDELGNGDDGPLGDGDGFNESISISGSTYDWYAEFDSTAMSDGAIDVHYVVADSGGNGRHYVEPGFVKNFYPTFGSVVLSTDINGNGNTTDTDLNRDGNVTADDTEYATYASPSGSLTTNFTGRNDLLYVEVHGCPVELKV
jgi:hypothetical protein